MILINRFLIVLGFSIILNSVNAQEINSLLVGNNLWYKDPSTQVWNLTKDCGVKFIRIGGAEYDRNMPSTTVLLGWVNKVQGIGAEAQIQVSQYQTPEQAAAIVKYFNKEAHGNKLPIKYWCIGNEPWLQANRPSTATFGAVIEKYYKPIAKAMKEVDSTILIFGPDECDYIDDIYNDLFGGKNDITGKVEGKSYYYCDGLSWHRYPQGSGDPATEGASDMLVRIKKAKDKVDYVNKLHNRAGTRALQWGIGEYNAKGGPEVHTWGNGQMFGATLGGCMKYGATYAATWSMFESGGNRQGTDFSSIDGTMIPRASYRHMQFVAKYFKGTYADGKSSNTNIIVYGAKNADTIAVMIMNRATTGALEYSLFLNLDSISSSGIQISINAANSKSYKDYIQARSTQVLVFKGNELLKIVYTSNDFDNGLPPTENIIREAAIVPRKIEKLSSAALSYNSIQLNWEKKTDTITGMVIERSTDAVQFNFVAITNGKDTFYIDNNLLPETNYSYRIRAYNFAGQAENSNITSSITLAVPPQIPYGTHTIPGKVQVEDYDNNDESIAYHDIDNVNEGKAYRLNQGVDIENCTDIDGGYNVGYINNGEWLEYTIGEITDGTYDIAIRAASKADGTKKIKVKLGSTILGSVSIPNTGDWQAWKTFYISDVNINGGNNQVLRLDFEGKDFNLNWIEFGTFNTKVKNETNTSLQVYYKSSSKAIYIEFPKIQDKVNITVNDILGRKCLMMNKNKFSNGELQASNLEKGIYILTIRSSGAIWSKNLAIY